MHNRTLVIEEAFIGYDVLAKISSLKGLKDEVEEYLSLNNSCLVISYDW